MSVAVKLLGFAVWLLSINCGQCEVCSRDDIIYEDVEPLQKASFGHGEIVKVVCRTGFTGMYRIKCENGKWTESISRPCKKKTCSHPGDIANGDFQLFDETEFVFGARVVYFCKKGFVMASRLNQRTCRSQGWDNAVPICEAVKCPAIHTDGDVTATGNVEEGHYGDVIRFECVSSEKKIEGDRDIYCTEKGEWSAPVPECKDITCTAPRIPNGEVVNIESVYQNNAQLKYRCLKGFKAREGYPRCASHGWTLNPECDAVTCELTSNYKVKSVDSGGKTIFKVGQQVTITCTEKGWFSDKENFKTFTCQDNGQWDSDPVCQDITCERPDDQHASFGYKYHFWGTMKLDEKRSYSCRKGYSNIEEKATCTPDGITPNPLCAEIVCPASDLQNADILVGQKQKYKVDSVIEYRCRTGFEPQNTVRIICDSSGQWRGIQRCTGMCAASDIQNAKIEGRQQLSYRIGSTIQYNCNPGFEPEGRIEITCDDQAQWAGLQQCTATKCQNLQVENGFTDGQTSDKKEMFYSCDKGYKPFNGKWWGSVTCSEGSWSEEPRCILEKECGELPSVQNGKVISNDYLIAKVVCDPGFIAEQSYIDCNNGTWEEPHCKVEQKCDIPPRVENALITSKPKELYLEGYSVTYKCQSKFLLNGKSTVLCHNGKWQETPICVAKKDCDRPPTLENGFIKSEPVEPNEEGSSVTYECRSPFKLIGKSTVFCHNGTWQETPECQVQCPRPHENYMELENDKIMYDNKEILKYKCLEPYTDIPEGQWICENGKWTGNFVCTSKICPPPPYVENGDHTKTKDVDRVATEVRYQCKAGHILSGRDRQKCEKRKWPTPPICLKPCEITPSLFQEHNIEPIQQTIYVTHGTKEYPICKTGFNSLSTGYHYVTLTCSNGKLDFESCV